MSDIVLAGLEGGNLLGYLAALGTLRLVHEQRPGARMSWREERGRWRPVIREESLEDADALLRLLAPLVCGEEHLDPALRIGADLTLPRPAFRSHLLRAAEEGSTREAAFLAALGSEFYGGAGNEEIMADTEFRTMSGAGHQHFLGFMLELARLTEEEHLRAALLSPWTYADDRPSLRWDPADYRPHALRAEDPSGDPIRTVRGANRLAVEALPLFPTVPAGRRLRTVGFQARGGETEITWAVWHGWLSARGAGAVAAMAELQWPELGPRAAWERRGIGQVYRAKRFTEGKYRNFSPARALL